MLFKVGDLAKRSGLTVRALHYYDAIGLLSPSVRTASGARRYGVDDVVRLHRVQAMKLLGFGLPEIRATLDNAAADPQALLQAQIQLLVAQARQARALAESLHTLLAQISSKPAPLAGDWLDSLEMMALYQQHLSEDDRAVLFRARRDHAGATDVQWSALVAEVAQALGRALPADDPHAQALAWRWVRLVIAQTGNNPRLAIKLRQLHASAPRAQNVAGVGPAMMAWIASAIAHARTSLFAKYLTAGQTEVLRQSQLRAMADLDRWPGLVARLQDQWDAGTPAHDPAVQALAREWQALFHQSYGAGDADMLSRLRTAFANEPDLMLGVGVSSKLMAYVHEALAFVQPPMTA